MKELSILTYSSLKINHHLGRNWIIHIVQYLLINEAPLIFTSFFAGFASVCLFFFFLYTFGKYKNNRTINDDFKLHCWEEDIKEKMEKLVRLSKLDRGTNNIVENIDSYITNGEFYQKWHKDILQKYNNCLLYTSPSPRDRG